MTAFRRKPGEQPSPVPRDGSIDPFWPPEGRTVYSTGARALRAAALDADGRFSEPRKVVDLPDLTVLGAAPDGRFRALHRSRAPVTRLEIILNWLQALERTSAR